MGTLTSEGQLDNLAGHQACKERQEIAGCQLLVNVAERLLQLRTRGNLLSYYDSSLHTNQVSSCGHTMHSTRAATIAAKPTLDICYATFACG